MSLIEEVMSDIIALQRELLSNLKLEEKSFLEKDINLTSSLQGIFLELKKKISSKKTKLKKIVSDSCEELSVEFLNLEEQQVSLDRKIRELVKSNKRYYKAQ